MRKIRVGILFGGVSAEHEVSLQSARNVIDAIDKNKYEVVLIGIDKQGQWYLNESSHYLLNAQNPKLIALNKDSAPQLSIVPAVKDSPHTQLTEMGSTTGVVGVGALDVIFPVLHGTMGEDGTVQGLLKLTNIPFVGAGVLGSAVGMDKDVMKRLFREAGLPTAEFITVHQHKRSQWSYEAVVQKLKSPFFVKPANAGSSVGISKVKSKADFEKALDEAFLFDTKILIEEFVVGREIEVAVLGNENPKASIPGEILPHHEFYSYDAKYIDDHGASTEVPAKLSKEEIAKVQVLAVKSFEILCCEGMARVDFFLKENGEFYVNEINTIPGFTSISMYPKMWQASGISYPDLIDRLIGLAMERFERDKKIKMSYV